LPLIVTPPTTFVDGAGATFAQTFTVSESGYSGTFTETDTCGTGGGAIASLSPASGSGPSLIITATGINAGMCVATYQDSFGQTAPATIVVTITNIGINGRQRKR